GGCEPDQAEQEPDRPGESEQDAQIGRNALAAPELEPDWKEMPDEGAEASNKRKARIVGMDECEHRYRALERIADQRRGRQPLVAGAQHIGCADIAGADAAQILRARKARDDDAERDRAEQIAECERGEEEHGLNPWSQPLAARRAGFGSAAARRE